MSRLSALINESLSIITNHFQPLRIVAFIYIQSENLDFHFW